MEKQKIYDAIKQHCKTRNDTNKAVGIILNLFDVSNRRELLIAFFEYANPIYWGDNEITEYEDIIELFLKSNL